MFKGQQISVEKNSQTVLWVTNYPPTFDEEKLRDLFSKVCCTFSLIDTFSLELSPRFDFLAWHLIQTDDLRTLNLLVRYSYISGQLLNID